MKRRAFCKKVRCIETDEIFFSVKEAAASIGKSAAALSQHLNGYPHHNSCGGFHFEYVEEKEEETNAE